LLLALVDSRDANRRQAKEELKNIDTVTRGNSIYGRILDREIKGEKIRVDTIKAPLTRMVRTSGK
jgi:hypothetical protein